MNKYLSKKIENISFLSIIMVVFLHSRNYIDKLLDEHQPAVFFNLYIQNFITLGITRVAVPIFFTISGYLFFLTLKPTINGFLNKYKSRAKSLFIPYLIWSTWGLLIYYVLHLIPLSKSAFSYMTFLDKNFTLKFFFNNLFSHTSVFTFQLWFLNTLIKLVIISPFIYIVIKRLKSLSVWVLLLMWFSDLSIPLLRRTEGWLFFTIGSYLAIIKPEIRFKHSPKASLFLLFIWIISISLTTFFITYYRSETIHFSFYVRVMHNISILIGMSSIWLCYDYFYPQLNETLAKKLKVITSLSFFLFVFHEPFLSIIIALADSAYGYSNSNSLIIFFSAPIIVIGTSLLLGYLLRDKLNPVYKFLTGNR